jgi:predicted amidohydrolase
LRSELELIAKHCAACGVTAIIGSAHPLAEGERPHNSLYGIGGNGVPETRYDKRFLSNTEINDWYTPGFEPAQIELASFRFGLSICIEAQFAEIFAEYERLGVDCVLHATYGMGPVVEIILRAHAATNCIWLSVASPANCSDGASGIIGPDGNWLARCGDGIDIAIAVLDRDDPKLDIALNKARPWRRQARAGAIYADRRSQSPRSADRTQF